MSFADLTADMQTDCFALLGEAAVYTPPVSGGARQIRAMLEEPTEPPFVRELPRSAFRERSLSIWLPLVDDDGAAFSPAKDGTVALLNEQGDTVRTVTLVSLQASDPDRVLWACREVTP